MKRMELHTIPLALRRRQERNERAQRVLQKSLEGAIMSDVDEVDASMEVSLITDALIKASRLHPVTNPVPFERGSIPTADGLFSEYIFGTTEEERMRQHAYIDLKETFFHPYVYEILTSVYRNIGEVCSGEDVWTITDAGTLKRVSNHDDPNYNENHTGVKWLIQNFKKIKFKENDTIGRTSKLEFLRSLADEEMFISKFVVIPVFYRDAERRGSKSTNGATISSMHELNYTYSNVIRYVNSLAGESSGFAFYQQRAMFNIQLALVKIRKFGQSLIAKKQGAFHQSVLGKSIDLGQRSVITVPVLLNVERPKDSPINMLYTGIPMSQCIVQGYPFIMKWLLEFFAQEFDERTTKACYRRDPETGELILEHRKIKNQMNIFTQEFLDKKLVSFINTPGMRFDPIPVQMEDGTETFMVFTGRGYERAIQKEGSAITSTRPMTWTDLIYLACQETLSNKHVYTTRYPLEDYFGIFPTRVHVLSTTKTQPMVVNGEVYPHYPIVELGLPENLITTRFNDTVTMSNLYLKGLGGDYDGDTVSSKMVFSLEANEEAEEIIKSIKHYITISGNIMREMGNEATLCLYNMTKYED